MRVRQRGVLAVIGIVRIWAASIISARRHARRNVLIDGNDEVKPTQMLVAHTDSGSFPKLLLNLKAALLGIRILHLGVHRRKIHEHTGWKPGVRKNVRENRGPGLGRGKTNTDLA